MASILKRLVAKVLIALASQPALRSAAVKEVVAEIDLDHAKDIILEEMDATSYASHRPEYHARYFAEGGAITAMPDQLRAMLGRKLANGCLGASEETESFIAARTR